MSLAVRHRPSDARPSRQIFLTLVLPSVNVLAVGGVVFLRVGNGPRSVQPTPSQPSASPSPNSRMLVAQTQAQWRALDATLTPCDAAARGGDRTLALDASRLCRRAGLALLAAKPPAAANPTSRARFEAALADCQFHYLRRGNAYARLARAEGPAILEARADVDKADLETHGCRIGYIAAARAADVPFDAFPPPVAGF